MSQESTEPVLSMDAVAQKVTAILGGLDLISDVIDAPLRSRHKVWRSAMCKEFDAVHEAARDLAKMIREARVEFKRSGGMNPTQVVETEPWCQRCLASNARMFDYGLQALRCSDFLACARRVLLMTLEKRES